MAWTSPRTWVAGEVVTAALLNTHLRDNLMMLEFTPAVDVTAAPNVTSSATKVYRRGGYAFVNVDATTTAALATNDTLFTLPSGYRPPVSSIFATLFTSGGTVVRVHVEASGAVLTQVAVSSGVILRASFLVPLG